MISVLLVTILVPGIAAACEGGGGNIITIEPAGGLKWASKEEGVKKFTIKVLNPIEMTEQSTTDPTDFSLPGLSGCKVGTVIESSKPCEVEVKRITQKPTGEKRYKWKYKEGTSPGTGPEGSLEGL